ncbi:uncharacterized protein IL334_000323 [Kwoniella shivajii]|uniref:Uncharacterized protein n=1 Tax=Kwoniella shivajii TaxID=564305 RepID=A0ABZ1CPE4_9TREE|nr:hypothetical protein IL334_000323 [Kwoniella shivajii]
MGSKAKTKSEGIQNSPYPHTISIFLSFTCTLFLFLVILYNVPFSADDTNRLSSRLWLVQVKDKGREYGFGIWGWCSWSTISTSAGSTVKDGTKGMCVKQSFWKLDDRSVGIKLPSEIAKSLSISGFFLIFVLTESLALLINLLITIKFHSPVQPPINSKIEWLSSEKYAYRTWTAYTLRNIWRRLIVITEIIAFGLPVLIVAGVGVQKFDDGVQAKLGAGWSMTLSAVLILVLIQVDILVAGLWNNSKRSGKKH